MEPRAQRLISELGLRPHPEGGYYGEVYRSSSSVQPSDARSERRALTTIYFLLIAGQVSRWHRVSSDEVWHFYEGAALELLTTDDSFRVIERHRLGDVHTDTRPVHVVPARRWQAARSTGTYTLVGCTVGPGFEFDDFQLLDTASELARAARANPEAATYV
jgi:predicted cupin superfamily sugar epimerase